MRPASADRVLTTILFADIVGSTERVAALGDRLWRDLIGRHHAMLPWSSLIRRYLLPLHGGACPGNPERAPCRRRRAGLADGRRHFMVPVASSGANLKGDAEGARSSPPSSSYPRREAPSPLLVPSRVDRCTGPGREIEAAQHDLEEPVERVISQRIAHVYAFTAGQWIGQFGSQSTAHAEISVLAALITRKVLTCQSGRHCGATSAPKPHKAERDLKQLKKIGAEQRKELESSRPPVADDMVTTAIHVSKRVLALLRNAAVGRANRVGGRPSVSALATELVEKHRKDLEAERD
jgi:hypothetical protein